MPPRTQLLGILAVCSSSKLQCKREADSAQSYKSQVHNIPENKTAPATRQTKNCFPSSFLAFHFLPIVLLNCTERMLLLSFLELARSKAQVKGLREVPPIAMGTQCCPGAQPCWVKHSDTVLLCSLQGFETWPNLGGQIKPSTKANLLSHFKSLGYSP